MIPSTEVLHLTFTVEMTRLSKHQSMSTTVLFRTTFIRTIKLNLLMKWLPGTNLSRVSICWHYVSLQPKLEVLVFLITYSLTLCLFYRKVLISIFSLPAIQDERRKHAFPVKFKCWGIFIQASLWRQIDLLILVFKWDQYSYNSI